MLAIDASAVTELLLGRPAGVVVAGHFAEHDFALHAPLLTADRRLGRTIGAHTKVPVLLAA